MKGITLALVLLMLRADGPAPSARVEFDTVGLAVDLSESWEVQGADTGERNGRTEFGFVYVVDIEIPDSSNYHFDDLLLRRHDYFGVDRREEWVRGDGRKGMERGMEIVSEGFRMDLPAFDGATAFRYEQVRGLEPHQRSSGYLVFAVKDTSAFGIRIGGLTSEFEAQTPRYESILRSITVLR